jgi:hypothetical protein
MESHDGLEQQIWELVYDLLPEDEAEQLRQRVCSDPQLARLYADVKLKSQLVAEATRIQGPRQVLSRPDRGTRAGVRSAFRGSASSPWVHRIRDAAPWLIAAAAALLLWFTGFTYLKPDSPVRGNVAARMQEQLLDEPVRTTVLGPRVLPRNHEGYLALLTRTEQGRPAPATVSVRWMADDHRLLQESEVATDAAGLAQIRTPAFADENRVRFELVTRGRQTTFDLAGSLDVQGGPLTTHVATDRPVYRPGETIRYRSVTLSRFDLTSPGESEVDYRLMDGRGNTVARTTASQRTKFGVGSGEFRVPPTALAGEYAVVASSNQGVFPESRSSVSVLSFPQPEVFLALDFDKDSYSFGEPVTGNVSVRNTRGEAYAGARMEMTVESDQSVLARKALQADDQGRLEFSMGLPAAADAERVRLRARLREDVEQSLVREIPVHSGLAQVVFYPESGELVAGVPNRVYFFAHNDAGQAISLRGPVVDTADRVVAQAETQRDGRGVISLVPEAMAEYRLRIASDDGDQQIPLPATSSRQFLVLRPETSVLSAEDPLAVTVHTVRPERPVAISAACRGTVVGQTLIRPEQFAGQKSDQGSCRADVPLDERADGVIRLTAYDYSVMPPVPIAERLVFREPSRRLDIRLEGTPRTLTAGSEGRLRVSVQDEQERSCPAVLGVSVVDDALFGLVEDQPVGIATHFWLTSQVPSAAALEDASIYLEPGNEDLLDLLLGTQGWRRIVSSDAPQLASTAGAESAGKWSKAKNLQPIEPDGVEPSIVADNQQDARAVLAGALRNSLKSRQSQLHRTGIVLLAASSAVVLLILLWKWLLPDAARFAWASALLVSTSCLVVGICWMTANVDAQGDLAWGRASGGVEGTDLAALPPEVVAVEAEIRAEAQTKVEDEAKGEAVTELDLAQSNRRLERLERKSLARDGRSDLTAADAIRPAPEPFGIQPDERRTEAGSTETVDPVPDESVPSAAEPFSQSRDMVELQEVEAMDAELSDNLDRLTERPAVRGGSLPQPLSKKSMGAAQGQSGSGRQVDAGVQDDLAVPGGGGSGGLGGGGLGSSSLGKSLPAQTQTSGSKDESRGQAPGRSAARAAGNQEQTDGLGDLSDAAGPRALKAQPDRSRGKAKAPVEKQDPAIRRRLAAGEASSGELRGRPNRMAFEVEPANQPQASEPPAAEEPQTSEPEAASQSGIAGKAMAVDKPEMDSEFWMDRDSELEGLERDVAESTPLPTDAPADIAAAAGQPAPPAVTAPAVTAPAVTAPAVTAPAVTAPATGSAPAPAPAPTFEAEEAIVMDREAPYAYREYASWGTERGWFASPMERGTAVWVPLLPIDSEGGGPNWNFARLIIPASTGSALTDMATGVWDR